MFDLTGKMAVWLLVVGLLSTGVVQCSVDSQGAAALIRGVVGAMTGSANPEIDGNGGKRCLEGVCLDTRPSPVRRSPNDAGG